MHDTEECIVADDLRTFHRALPTRQKRRMCP
jgi:hypothetical protein